MINFVGSEISDLKDFVVPFFDFDWCAYSASTASKSFATITDHVLGATG
jgi:hypothetical protein